MSRNRRMNEICHLQPFYRKPIGQLSRGQKQRTGFAAAILHDPDDQ